MNMAFQRAQWHSGLTYQQTCPQCKTVFLYTDHSLDFRPWYADGFVDCPNCKTHIRHDEKFALDIPHVNTAPVPLTSTFSSAEENAVFCGRCGTKFADGDTFCSKCGAKRGKIAAK